MSLQSNQGILLAVNGDASNGSLQMPTNGSIYAPLTPNVGIAQRCVLTVSGILNNGCTSYVISLFMRNKNLFQPISSGYALPGNPGYSTDPNLELEVPTLASSQTSTTAGALSTTLTYTTLGNVRDLIELAGPLTGILVVKLAAAGVPTPGDLLKISLDIN